MSSAIMPLPPMTAPSPEPTRFQRIYGVVRVAPFFLLHFACISLFYVAPTTTSLILCVSLYVIRMFGITAGFHRYFAHRAYKTSRPFQFVLAWIGTSAMQKGPLWWAGHHRHHHKYSDQEGDPHSPVINSVWWSHVGWILSRRYDKDILNSIRDFASYPELRILNKFHWVPGFLLAGVCYWIDGLSGLVWGFLVSTILLYHGTFLVNSLCHVLGRKRYVTGDESRNNVFAAIVTLGEGWHNNHHCYQSSANQGFFWWELDISYTTLRVLSLFGLVWGLRKPPLEKLEAMRIQTGAQMVVPQPEPERTV